MALHTAATDFTERTTVMAQIGASNLLAHIDDAMEQAVTQKTIPGALSKPSDRALFLIGHDTNLTNMAGLLNLTWIADGRRDDTPPGGHSSSSFGKTERPGNYRSVLTLRSRLSSRCGHPPP